MSVLHRVLTALVAVALVAAATVGVAEIALAALDRPPWIVPRTEWTAWLQQRAWTDTPVRAALVGMVVLGLLLLLTALRRGRPATLPLTSSEAGVTLVASRRSVERVLAATAQRAEGVTTAQASVKRRRVRVDARTRLRDPGDLPGRLSASVQERLADLGLSERLRPTIRVRHEEAR